MSISIGSYEFDGPYYVFQFFEDRSGVYAVLDKNIKTGKDGKDIEEYGIIDIGESYQVKSRLETHDRAPCWEKNKTGTLCYAVYYTPGKQQSGRQEIEQELRMRYNPPCGDR